MFKARMHNVTANVHAHFQKVFNKVMLTVVILVPGIAMSLLYRKIGLAPSDSSSNVFVVITQSNSARLSANNLIHGGGRRCRSC